LVNREQRVRGLYVALDGADGSGKSSQARRLADHLEAEGEDVLLVREPGATPAGEALRAMLLDPSIDLSPLGEALLFFAARAELVRRVVAPALASGRTVVSDRCFASTLVYQQLAVEACPAPGPERAPGMALLLDLVRSVHEPAMPDVVYVLDVTAGTARRRRSRRPGVNEDRFEARDAEFQELVCESFRALTTRDDVAALFVGSSADRECGVVRIDAEIDADSVHEQLLARVVDLAVQRGRGA
jgi:dTMP kinase